MATDSTVFFLVKWKNTVELSFKPSWHDMDKLKCTEMMQEYVENLQTYASNIESVKDAIALYTKKKNGHLQF